MKMLSAWALRLVRRLVNRCPECGGEICERWTVPERECIKCGWRPDTITASLRAVARWAEVRERYGPSLPAHGRPPADER